MGWHVVTPDGLEWEERERSGHEAPRWHAPVTDALALQQSRARMWRYSPGGRGRRHKDLVQEEVFVVLEGRMTAYMGEPPERVDLPAGSVLAVEPGTPLQLRNESDADARFFAYGAPPEVGGAGVLARRVARGETYSARMRLLRGLCSTSARPSSSSTGGT